MTETPNHTGDLPVAGAGRAEDDHEPIVVGPVGEETAAPREPVFEEPMVEEVERPGERPEDVERPYGEDAPATSGTRPAEAGDLTVEHLIDPDEADRFDGRWRDVKAVFVDDPSDALRQASALSEEVVAELTTALRRAQENMDEAWQEGETRDTERMRIALRGYGSLLDRVLALTR
jgi:hypothetical protein